MSYLRQARCPARLVSVTVRSDSLTLPARSAKRDRAMKQTLLYAFAALSALSACNNSAAEETAANTAAPSNQVAAPVELPPAITAEKTLRCKDNSLVYVTFFEGNRQALVRTEQNGTPTMLKAEAAGDPLVADGGYRMTGTPASIELTLPGKGAQACRA